MPELGRKSINEFKQASKTPIVIILDNVRSMHNVGSVFRSADAFLVEAIFLCGFTPVPPHREIHKTALGATETVQWKYFPNTLEAIETLKQDGYGIYAVEQVNESFQLNQLVIDQEEKLGIVFGNEVSGVDAQVIANCNGCIEIPQLGMKHSLNISVAAGIVMWELMRERI